MNPLHVNFLVNTDTDHEFTIVLEGSLNASNATDFNKDLLRLIRTENKNCLINIEKLETIDRSAYNVLTRTQKTVERYGLVLSLVSEQSNPILRRIRPSWFSKNLILERA